MQTIHFKTATVTIDSEIKLLKTTFHDGKVNDFYYDDWIFEREDYMQTAKDMGYEDIERYAIDHEPMHHFIADNLGWRHSFAVWENTWHPEPWPAHISWEEHLVNKMQRFVQNGTGDEYGVLDKVFANRLIPLADDFRWLSFNTAAGSSFIYDPDTGNLSFH